MGFKKGESIVSERNQGKQIVVVQDLGTGEIWVYKRMSDLAEAAGVRPGTLRNLISRGENEFRGYRVTRVKSFGGIDFGVVPSSVVKRERKREVVEDVKEDKRVKRKPSSFEVLSSLSSLNKEMVPKRVFLGSVDLGGDDDIDLDQEF